MTNLSTPRVGILIPTRNRVGFLRMSLDSALAQEYTPLEILVIDNRSDDGTGEYVRGIPDPRLRYILNERDIGLSGSINKGIGLLGDEVAWCTILCDDDLLGPGSIGSMLRSASRSSAGAVIHCHRLFVDGEGRTLREAPLAPKEESALDYLAARTDNLRETYLTGVMFSRSAFRDIGGYPAFPTGLATDDALIFALAIKDRLVYEARATVSIRIHPEAESQSPADPAAILGSLETFREYCLAKAAESGRIDPRRMAEFESLVDRYLVRINSSQWVNSLRKVAGSGERGREMIDRLCSFAVENADCFSSRVRLDSFLIRRAAWNPETCPPYVHAWEALKNLYRYLKGPGPDGGRK